jgi:hypothetical protein
LPEIDFFTDYSVLLRLSFAHFKLGGHFLDLRGLLFQGGSKDFDFLLLFRGSRLLL